MRFFSQSGFERPKTPVIAGHRGWPERFPDNTLAGFRAAAEVVGMVEIDVRRSRDGELVLSHDPEILGRVVAESDWSELALIDVGDGHHPILLGDLISAVPELALDIEIKNWPFQPGFEDDGATAVEAAEMARPGDVVTCFYWPTMDIVKAALPQVATGLLVDEGGSIPDAIAHARAMGHELIAPHWSLVDGTLPDDLVTSVWTMNDESKLDQLAEWGVDIFITDDPGRLADALGDPSNGN